MGKRLLDCFSWGLEPTRIGLVGLCCLVFCQLPGCGDGARPVVSDMPAGFIVVGHGTQETYRWSPDSNRPRIIFRGRRDRAHAAYSKAVYDWRRDVYYVLQRAGTPAILRVDARDGHWTVLHSFGDDYRYFTGQQLEISSDCSRLYFVGAGRLYYIVLPDGEPIAFAPLQEERARWVGVAHLTGALYVQTGDGILEFKASDEAPRLAFSAAESYALSVSPSGKTMLLWGVPGQASGLALLSTATGEIRDLPGLATLDAWCPTRECVLVSDVEVIYDRSSPDADWISLGTYLLDLNTDQEQSINFGGAIQHFWCGPASQRASTG